MTKDEEVVLELMLDDMVLLWTTNFCGHDADDQRFGMRYTITTARYFYNMCLRYIMVVIYWAYDHNIGSVWRMEYIYIPYLHVISIHPIQRL